MSESENNKIATNLKAYQNGDDIQQSTPDFDDEYQLLGIPVADSTPAIQESATEPKEVKEDGFENEQPFLSFRDAEVPGRDFQPRLLRFGDAA